MGRFEGRSQVADDSGAGIHSGGSAAGPVLTYELNRRKMLWLTVFPAVFAVFGVFGGIVSGSIILAAVSLLFFGGLAWLLYRRVRDAHPVLFADAAGIHLLPAGAGVIPWGDIEHVRVSQYAGVKYVGVRLRSYDNLVRSVSSEMREKQALALKRSGQAMIAISPFAVETILDVHEAVQEAERLDRVDTRYVDEAVVKAMQANRKRMGVDLAWSGASFSKKPEIVTDELEVYRRQAVA
ncbi:STM3941 family protein [Agromyces sp. NPDC057679]|uniref:STM3941 family protein n=1 Tax=Agromyces sp. NPDC057679 TaxID=3346207 RepID=UPI0036706B1E